MREILPDVLRLRIRIVVENILQIICLRLCQLLLEMLENEVENCQAIIRPIIEQTNACEQDPRLEMHGRYRKDIVDHIRRAQIITQHEIAVRATIQGILIIMPLLHDLR